MKAAILLPVLANHDAVGNDAMAMAQILRERGIDTRIYCDVAVGLNDVTHRPDELLGFAGGPDDLVIYHFSVGWPTALEILRKARGRRVVRYHNITPAHFFAPIAVEYADVCTRGRAEIGRIVALGCDLYLGDSHFNLDELIEHGAPADRGAVFAPFHRVEHLHAAQADLDLLDELADDAFTVLMVGRIAPNKGHVELIEAFAAFVDAHGDPARLLIVGKSDPRLQAYVDAVRGRIEHHRLGDRVIWLESVNEARLKAAYLSSDVFMTLSQHEGFCVPVIEAMALGVPVLARATSALPETVGAGGLCWDSEDPHVYAASLARLRGDAQFRRVLREKAHRRYASEFSPAVLRARLLGALDLAP
ncbi:MAG: glycosyltransferase [Dokdonella sp.]|uniref:glycosyltransferase n=1 Tax=Dokdonella sp. TaxID=2291710 RepID=UPI0025BD9087|nr:glycosyltransferase [Dokdonella sp.]MBZ0221956.1 glycosyltransferase [Dokdonella sp.]